jgi:hypothetical protein
MISILLGVLPQKDPRFCRFAHSLKDPSHKIIFTIRVNSVVAPVTDVPCSVRQERAHQYPTSFVASCAESIEICWSRIWLLRRHFSSSILPDVHLFSASVSCNCSIIDISCESDSFGMSSSRPAFSGSGIRSNNSIGTSCFAFNIAAT